jgi:thioredoxin reductase (NADPH)
MANPTFDVIIVGGGPAGLSAAIYMARAQYRTLVVEKEKFGGQITITSEVVNYPGVRKTSGSELTEDMRKQAESFGAEFLLAEVTELDLTDDIKTVKTDKGVYASLGIVLATGASPRMIGFKGEAEFRGRGVAYCATCDGEFFTGKEVFVVGAGFAAAEEAVFLTKYASHVTILAREPDFTCAGAVADEAKSHPDITIHYNTQVEEVGGDSRLRHIVYKNDVTGEVTRYQAAEGDTFGVFVFAGYAPANSLFASQAQLNDQGYLVTDLDQKTSLEGVYGAGDICIKNLRQVVTAVSDGAKAATSLEHHVSALHEKLDLPAFEVRGPAPAPATQADAEAVGDEDGFITPEIRQQLAGIFSRFERPVILKASVDESPIAKEVEGFVTEIAGLSDLLTAEIVRGGDETPAITLCDGDGAPLGFTFHGVPGGHEFNSFVVTLYNAAGPGQPLGDDQRDAIRSVSGEHRLQIAISLSCTQCPDLVMAAGRLALENPGVTVDVYDLNHFEDLKNTYDIMSVPCLIADGKNVHFGKKNIEQLAGLLS